MALWIPARKVRGTVVPGHWETDERAASQIPRNPQPAPFERPTPSAPPDLWLGSSNYSEAPRRETPPTAPQQGVFWGQHHYGAAAPPPSSGASLRPIPMSAESSLPAPHWAGGGSWVRPQGSSRPSSSGGATSTRTRDAVRSVPVMRPPGQVAPSHPTSHSASPRNWDGSGASAGQDPMLFGEASQPRPGQDPMLLGDTSQHYAAMADMGVHPDAPAHPQAAQAVLSQLGLGEEANQAYWNAARDLIAKSPQMAAGHLFDEPDPRYGFGPYFSAQTFNGDGSPAGPASAPGTQNSAAYAAWLALKNANQAQLSSPEWRQTLADITAESYYAPGGPRTAAHQPNAWRDYLPQIPVAAPPGPYQGAMNAYAAQMPSAFAL